MIKHIKSKSILTALILTLCLSISFGVTLAYFSDYEEASGGAVMNLKGETEIEEHMDGTTKHIVVKNTGDRTNMITRVLIFDNQYMTVSFNKSDWYEVVKDGYKIYYCRKVLKPGDESGELTASLKTEWSGSEKPDYDFDVTVVHESAIATYDGDKVVVPTDWNDIPGEITPAPLANSGKEGE